MHIRKSAMAGALIALGVASWGVEMSAAQTPARGVSKVYRAVVVTRDRATLSAEIPGRIIALPAGAGSAFKKGDVLVEFDCRYHRFSRDKIALEVEATKKKYENGLKMAQLASTGQLTVDLAQIDWKKAETELKGAELMVERCTVLAPFDGAVVRVVPQLHENVTAGQALVEVAGTSRVEIDTAVPSVAVYSLKVGAPIRFKLDDVGVEVMARIEGIAPVIDPVSQLVPLRATITQREAWIIPGMTGTLQVE